jgi:hypothetical protein
MGENILKVGLIPLDERPVNTRYPRLLAEIAGAEVILPPGDFLSDYRVPARSDALMDWLNAHAPGCDVLIAGCETLGYGGLIPSRTSHEPAATILARLETLRGLKILQPTLNIFGFNLITRIPHYNSAVEEPGYWAEYGANLYRLSQLMDRAGQGEPIGEELAELRARLPEAHISDFLQRRLRNHTVNLAAVGLAAEGIFDLLVVSSDDTSPYGLSSREKRWVSEWAARVNLGDRLLMYPGADEVGSILVARAVNQQEGRAPSFQVDYGVPSGDSIVAAFEDSAVRVTVERQIYAAGATIRQEGADILLLINPPRSPEHQWPLPYSEVELLERRPHLQAAVGRLARWLESGKPAAVADVAHANGADLLLVEMLREAGLLLKLDAYSAWNTAGNSIGTTVAQACLAWHGGRNSLAQRRFLAHRLVEDWAYMGVVRDQVTAWLEAETGWREPTPEMVKTTAEWIEQHLAEVADQLHTGFRIVSRSVRLPWNRTFEIDFDLEEVTPREGQPC